MNRLIVFSPGALPEGGLQREAPESTGDTVVQVLPTRDGMSALVAGGRVFGIAARPEYLKPAAALLGGTK